MNKSRKSVVLSKWFAVDRILFGKTNPKNVLGEDAYKGYITAKGAFLSGIHEIYRKIGYNPKQTFETLTEMQTFGTTQADAAKVRAKKILTTESVSASIRGEVKAAKLSEGVTSSQMAAYLIDRKIKSVSLDVVMLESAIAATGNKKSLTDFSGKIMLDAYKIYRDALVKYAY